MGEGRVRPHPSRGSQNTVKVKTFAIPAQFLAYCRISLSLLLCITATAVIQSPSALHAPGPFRDYTQYTL